MPLCHVAGRLVQFIHVPRAGGTAVEEYLARRFGPLGFLDRSQLNPSEHPRWTRSSPQHAEFAALDRLIPRKWVALRFAVVRHPVDRLASVYRFNRDVHGSIAAGESFADWIDRLPERRAADPHYLDNHPRPMVEMMPSATRVLKLEDGLDAVVEVLDDLEGMARGPRTLARANSVEQRLAQIGRDAGPEIVVTDGLRDRIEALYAEDFRRFGYAMAEQEGQGA